MLDFLNYGNLILNICHTSMETRSTMISNCDQTIPRQAMPHIEGVVGPRTPLYHMCFLLKIDETQNTRLVYVGSTEIFRFLAIYKYLRASTRLIDAFSAGDHQVFSKPLPFDFDLCHRHVTRPTTKAAVTAAATAATASPLALPSSTPFPLETHARKYVHFVSFFSSILLFNLIHSRNVCTFVRPFLSFLFFFFFFCHFIQSRKTCTHQKKYSPHFWHFRHF